MFVVNPFSRSQLSAFITLVREPLTRSLGHLNKLMLRQPERVPGRERDRWAPSPDSERLARLLLWVLLAW